MAAVDAVDCSQTEMKEGSFGLWFTSTCLSEKGDDGQTPPLSTDVFEKSLTNQSKTLCQWAGP